MARKPLRLCPICRRNRTREGRCPDCKPKKESREDATQRGYDYQWQKATRRVLNGKPNPGGFLSQPENQFCLMCKEQGKLTVSECVDHIVPHGGDEELFWDRSNWQPLCIPCNSSKGSKGGKAGRGGIKS